MTPVEVVQGGSPVVLGLPHTGAYVPADIRAKLNERGRGLADTDWNIHKLYAGLLPGVTTVRATFHRYVIDANRDSSGESLYPGQNTTGLVPMTDFDGRDIWHVPPSGGEVEHRREMFHAPYHAALNTEMARVKAIHGVAVLYDCHSIRSRIPFLFESTLPDFNIGTNDGTTCAPKIAEAVAAICEAAKGYSAITNGRFKGGWTTRHYGRPGEGLHAIQMELAQSTYMEEAPPWPYLHERADRLRPHLKSILCAIEQLALQGDLA
ncbi:N-formylglutamate amidohydrolase [Roseovarius gaetbuli]|uniref:N-formylglutamate amidohydrolase n=1 Tax=Roseovarius gaetbuli TaxID=1356575 RepID=A0A1X6YL76_9RHOB|nr:N-formylglutamate deformylase [Roseovarius gaetbuli]SLN24313.1 N-formylglutamate amidohydrolase [Roseovarius gaetbuli]